MAQTLIRRYGKRLPIGELNGHIITAAMLKKRQSNLPTALAEFLQYIEQMNRGKA